MENIVIENKQIVNFYRARPHMCFEKINLAVISMLSSIENSENSENSVCETIQQKILDAITYNNNNINIMTSNMEVNHRDYINNIRNIVETSTSETLETLLTENNKKLVNQTMETIVDIIPKNNESCFMEINNTLAKYYDTLSNDTQKLINSVNTIGIKEYMNNFEIKSTMMLQNIHQPIYSFISASEERTNKNMNDMKEVNDVQYKQLIHTVNDTIQKSVKCNQDIDMKNDKKTMMCLLSGIFSSAELFKKQQDYNTILMKRLRKTNIFLHSFETNNNLSLETVNNFRQRMNDENCSGILISHNSGISTTSDYEIEIQNNNVLLYIHNLDYSTAKLEVGVHIIDNLHTTLYQTTSRTSTNEHFTIPCEVLENINNEYQVFVTQKNNLTDMVKDNQKKMLSQIDDFKFPFLDKFLSSKYSKASVKPGYKCDICKLYNAHNLKALAAHKRGCTRKHGVKTASPLQVERLKCITPIMFEK